MPLASRYGNVYSIPAAYRTTGRCLNIMSRCSKESLPVTVAVLSNTENFFEVELMAFTIAHALIQESNLY